MQDFHHISVLLKESIDGLNIKPNGIYVDCTLGGGGHSSEVLKQLTNGFLYAFDKDQEAIEAATKKLHSINNQFEIIHSDFSNLKEELKKRNVDEVDGILFDLGVSSPQFDKEERGFSYKQEARLDMRMDRTQDISAYEIVNEYSFQDLYRIIKNYGEEKFAKSIAREIERTRLKKPIETTLELVEVIRRAVPAKSQRTKHPAKRTFQALRIETNKELEILPNTLKDAIELLKIGGRLCVITFHSLEDRIVKRTFKEYATTKELPRGLPVLPEQMEEPILTIINKKAMVASNDELEYNKRSQSAKLRVVEKNSSLNK